MRADVGVRTDVGRVREGNEDSYFVREPFFGVADGMGGHVAGDVASQTAVEVITGESGTSSPDPGALDGLVRAANRAIWQKSQQDASLRGMGTTCTLLLLKNGKAHLAHVGDSRAYLLRDSELKQITEDHTLVQRLVKEGRLQQEEAERHPQRNIITRSLGVDSDVQVDVFSIDVKPGDRFVINSDGLNSMIDNRTISATLTETSGAQAAADRLVELANEAGGEDNITVIVIDITDAAEGGAPLSGAAERRSPEEASTGPQPAVPTSPNTDDVIAPIDRTASSDLLQIPGAGSKLKPRWGRIAVVAVLLLLILGAGGYLAFRYLVLENSYFVGVNDAGTVTIYRGLPGEIAGMELHEEEEVTDLALDDLPSFLQDNVEEGIDADSLQAAQQQVADLQARAQDEEFDTGTNNDGGDNKPSDDKKNRNNT